MKSNNKYVSTIALTDLLFNLILGFVFLFLISFLLINKPEKTADVEKKAEMIVVMHWEDMHQADIDLWIETPNGVVNFVQPTRGAIFLDKDDLGIRNDWYFKPNGELEVVRINREVTTFRAMEQGAYTINAHYYSENPVIFPKALEEGWKEDENNKLLRGPANVTVEVIQLNPFKIVHTSSKLLSGKGAEETFINFRIKEGSVKDINYLPKGLVKSTLINSSQSQMYDD